MAWEFYKTVSGNSVSIDFDFSKYRYKFIHNSGEYLAEFRGYPGNVKIFTLPVGAELVVASGSQHVNVIKGLDTFFTLQIGGSVISIRIEREMLNNSPTLTLGTTNNQTLYSYDDLSISGTVQDADSGNTVTVKYSINNGTARTLHTFVSDGSAVSFNKPLTFKRDKLHDGSTAVTGELQEGVTHTLRVWAEDDQGGKSTVHSRTFNVIPNRPEVKVNGQSRVVETAYCKVNGQAREVVKVWTKVNGELREV